MKNMCRFSCMFALICLTHAQDFLDFPSLGPQQGNGFYQSPGFPPHFRPFGHHHGYQPYKDYSPIYYDSPFHNDVRSQLPNPYVPDYTNFYQQYPQFDQHYQHLSDFHKVPPSFRAPIQLIPSRFPPRIENVVERIQNHFSVYNPGLIVPNSAITPILVEITTNTTGVTSTTPATETEAPTTTRDGLTVTEEPAEPSTEAPAETATENDLSEGESNQSAENKEDESTTETSTEVSPTESS